MINVNFSDSTQTTIVAFFGCTQDASIFPNQGTVDASDARWKAFYEAQPIYARGLLPAPTA
jgi:hypothetical protein